IFNLPQRRNWINWFSYSLTIRKSRLNLLRIRIVLMTTITTCAFHNVALSLPYNTLISAAFLRTVSLQRVMVKTDQSRAIQTPTEPTTRKDVRKTGVLNSRFSRSEPSPNPLKKRKPSMRTNISEGSDKKL